MQQHPLSAVFPPMTETEMEELRSDIADMGYGRRSSLYEVAGP